ncbi:MAG: selenide, water dikinase SelD [Anaerolineales bacterium]|nr:selenide, water dikinase SelD [Anaerolineales bacterium]
MLRPVKGVFSGLEFPDLLVGLNDPDDAAVWRLDEARALVVTTDFFTPVVDDPYDYGAIAAANSLSDVYAMGGKPFLALNVLGLPESLAADVGGQILLGGAEKAKEAGVVVAGGHSIQDEEPKYGLIVLGFVHPEKAITKTGAKPGDRLFLTKPLGFGVTTSALKKEKADPADVQEVIGWMKQLNDKSADLAVSIGVRGCTDITGFSLLGHAAEMAEGSGVGLRLHFSQIPVVDCGYKYAQEWHFPGGAFNNRLYFGKQVSFNVDLDEYKQMLLFDPQTSGGLLLSVPPGGIEKFVSLAKKVDQPIWEIGEVVEGHGIVVLD